MWVCFLVTNDREVKIPDTVCLIYRRGGRQLQFNHTHTKSLLTVTTEQHSRQTTPQTHEKNIGWSVFCDKCCYCTTCFLSFSAFLSPKHHLKTHLSLLFHFYLWLLCLGLFRWSAASALCFSFTWTTLTTTSFNVPVWLFFIVVTFSLLDQLVVVVRVYDSVVCLFATLFQLAIEKGA